jgi:hypothetical protein
MTTLSLPWPTNDTKIPTVQKPPIVRRGSLNRTHSFLRLLQHYEAPGALPPPGARTDPRIEQREGIPFSLWNLWKIGYAAALKGKC